MAQRPTGAVGRVAGAALLALGLAVLLLRLVVRPRVVLPALAPVIALSGLFVVSPDAAMHLPGARRVHAAYERLPLPWRPVHPQHVPAPVVPSTAPAAATLDEALPAAETGAAQAAAQGAKVEQATPAAPAPPLPEAVKLQGIRHQWQTWNNCGPATMVMAVSYFGREVTQTQAANFLKPNPDDKNVSPDELVSYARTLGLQADWRVGGDLHRLKQLLANDIPVVVEVWVSPEPNDWMGHYRLLVGYDDRAGKFIAYDSYQKPGLNLNQPYAQFDDDWRVFNRTYIPVYTPEKAAVVAGILGAERDDRTMYERALVAAQREVVAQPENGFAWFNVGSSLAGLGRTAEAAQAFDRARTLKLPWRMLWYQFSPFEAYLAEGRLDDVLALAGANLQRTGDLEESHYYKGRALQAKGQAAQAKAAYQAAITANRKFLPAHHALASLG